MIALWRRTRNSALRLMRRHEKSQVKAPNFVRAETCCQFLLWMLTNALTAVSILHFHFKSILWLFIITLPLDVTFSPDVVLHCCQRDGEIS